MERLLSSALASWLADSTTTLWDRCGFIESMY
jgi:hypothetical protein